MATAAPRRTFLGRIGLRKSVAQIQKEFQTPQEFAHYRGPQRQRAFINLFYHQLLERGFWP